MYRKARHLYMNKLVEFMSDHLQVMYKCILRITHRPPERSALSISAMTQCIIKQSLMLCSVKTSFEEVGCRKLDEICRVTKHAFFSLTRLAM